MDKEPREPKDDVADNYLVKRETIHQLNSPGMNALREYSEPISTIKKPEVQEGEKTEIKAEKLEDIGTFAESVQRLAFPALETVGWMARPFGFLQAGAAAPLAKTDYSDDWKRALGEGFWESAKGMVGELFPTPGMRPDYERSMIEKYIPQLPEQWKGAGEIILGIATDPAALAFPFIKPLREGLRVAALERTESGPFRNALEEALSFITMRDEDLLRVQNLASQADAGDKSAAQELWDYMQELMASEEGAIKIPKVGELKAEFRGWQETAAGEYVAYYNVGRDTFVESTLRARGIEIPPTPPKPGEVPDWRKIAEHKKAKGTGAYVGSPGITTPQKLTTWRKDLRKLAEEGEEAKLWYERSAEALEKYAGSREEAERLIDQIAIFSIGARVPESFRYGMQSMFYQELGLPFTAGRYPTKQTAEAIAVYGGEAIQGPKRQAFAQNLKYALDPERYPAGPTAIDMWMMRAGKYTNISPSPEQYGFMEREIQRLALAREELPHQTQAAIWAAQRARYELAFQELLPKAREQGLVQKTPEFAKFIADNIDTAMKKISTKAVQKKIREEVSDYSKVVADFTGSLEAAAEEPRGAISFRGRIWDRLRGSGGLDEEGKIINPERYSKEIDTRIWAQTKEWPHIPEVNAYAVESKTTREPVVLSTKKEAHYLQIQPGQVYDGVADKLNLMPEARRIYGEITKTDPKPENFARTIFANLVARKGYRGYSLGTGKKGERWIQFFGEVPAKPPVGVKAGVSPVISSVQEMPERMTQVRMMAREPLEDFTKHIEAMVAEYPEITLGKIEPHYARFGDVTFGKNEYSLGIELRGPEPSIDALLSEASLQRKQAWVFYTREVEQAEAEGLRTLFQWKPEIDENRIQNLLASHNISDYDILERGDQLWLDTYVAAENEEIFSKLEILYAQFGVDNTFEFSPSIPRSFGGADLNKARDVFEEKLITYHGATRGQSIVGEAYVQGERYKAAVEKGERFGETGRTRLEARPHEIEPGHGPRPPVLEPEETPPTGRGPGEGPPEGSVGAARLGEIDQKILDAALGDSSRPLVEIMAEAEPKAKTFLETDISDLPEKAININFGRIESADDVKEVIAKTAEIYGPEIEAARRGVQSNMATQRLANLVNMSPEQLLKRRRGEPFKAEDALAARRILVSSGELLMKMARKVSAGMASDIEKFAFQKQLAVHYSIQAQVSGMTAEIGRALQQFRIMAKSTEGKIRQIQDFMESLKTVTSTENIAEMLTQIDTAEGVGRFVKEARKATTFDMLIEAWINALLSGPQTHAVNSLSNMLVAFYQIPERYLAAGIGKVFPGVQEIHRAEARAQAYGLIEGFKDGLRAFAKTAWTGEGSDVFNKLEIRWGAIKGANIGLEEGGTAARAVDLLGEMVRMPGRFLTAEDEFFKAIGYRMELRARAYRQAASEGLTGEDMAKRILEIVMDPPDDIHMAAVDAARYQTFTQDLGETGKAVQQALRKMPVLRFVVPFMRTPTNIVKFMGERTPLAFLSKRIRADIAAGGARRDLALARISLGTMVMGSVMSLCGAGYITGGGPSDPKLKAHKYNTGWKPYSIKIGEKYYAYNRLEPMGMLFGVAADAYEILEQAGDIEAQEVAATIIKAFSKNVTSKTWLRGISEFIEATEDPDRYGSRYLQNYARTLVPRAVSQIKGIEDPEFREVQNYLDAIKSQIPGLSKTLPATRNIWGEPIASEGGLGPDIVSPIYTSTAKYSPIDEELLRMKMPLTKPSKVQSFRGQSIELDPREYERYQILMNEVPLPPTGKPLKQSLDELVTADPEYKRMNEDRKKLRIREYVTMAKELAREKLYEESAEIQWLVDELRKEEMMGLQ